MHAPKTPADTPREMTRTERRVIFAKLEEVYADEVTGYKAGWTDQAVARDLGVPFSYIATVREENFGPARDNDEIRDLLARSENCHTEAKQLLENIEGIRKTIDANLTLLRTQLSAALDLRKQIDGLMVLATRIEKAVKP